MHSCRRRKGDHKREGGGDARGHIPSVTDPAERAKVRSWRQWAESELRFEQENRVASRS